MEQMYKVFLNDRRIIIGTPQEITNIKTSEYFDSIPDSTSLASIFKLFAKNKENELILTHKNPARLFSVFQDAFIKLPAAGGVVKRNGELMFIHRKGKWDLPKGKIDPGELPEQAALREVKEECGISGHQIAKKLPSTYHIYKSTYKNSRGEYIFKETNWFEMNYEGDDSGSPETAEGITKIKWFKPAELQKVLSDTYANLKQIIRLYRD